MKLTKTASGYKFSMTKTEWMQLGKQHGWVQTGENGEPSLAQDYDDLDFAGDMEGLAMGDKPSAAPKADLPPLQDETDPDGTTHPKPRIYDKPGNLDENHPDYGNAAPKSKPSLWHRALDGVGRGVGAVEDAIYDQILPHG